MKKTDIELSNKESFNENLLIGNTAFENFNSERISKQFLLMKQIIEGDMENADETVNQLLEMVIYSCLPLHIKKMIVYGLLDILMFRIQHSPFVQDGVSKEELLSFNEVNIILTSLDMNLVRSSLLEIYHRINEFDNFWKNNSKMSEVYDYIIHHFRDPQLTLNSIAEKFELNHTYVSNMFKREYGYNILEFIHMRRITEAKHWLITSELSISDISERIGYYSYRTFSKVFKRWERMTPTDFRELKRNFKENSTSQKG